jgi:hypothetical protein
MTKKIATLAAAFAALSQDSAALETRADAVLAIVKRAGIRGEKEFSAAVRDAYKENGWNTRQGKPKAGAPVLARVPATVKQYVSAVRACYRLKLAVGRFESFHALRAALKTARANRAAPVITDPRMAGLRLVQASTMTGAPFHDLTVLYDKLPRSHQSKLVGAVNGLIRQFQPAAPELLKLAA